MKVNLERPAIYPRPQALTVKKPAPTQAVSGADASSSGFGAKVGEAFASLESSAKASDQAADDLVAGQIDIHEALVQMEKADLTLKLGTTVRNKLLDAYQQLMNSASG